MITSTTDLKQYIPVSAAFNFEAFEPYLDKAAIKYTVNYVGNLHKSLLNVGSDEHESISQARIYLKTALANFALCLYFPFYQMQLGNTGPKVANSDKSSQPEWWMVKDARRELMRSGHEYLDQLLTLLDANSTHFPDWSTNYQSKYRELLVNNADVFSKYYEIFNSRQTYLTLVPSLRLIEDQYIQRFIVAEKITRLKTASDLSDDEKQVKEYLQKAVVAFTIARIYGQGLFHLDHTGLKLRFDVLPDEKVQAIDYGQPADQSKRASNQLIEDGTNYLRLAKTIITDKSLEGYLPTTTSAPSELYAGDKGVVGLI